MAILPIPKPGEQFGEVVQVTPRIAAAWIQRNTGNRPVNPARVDRYAASMRSGRWRLNGEPIIFDVNLDLMDGQHRLNAIVQSGVTVPMMVVYGIDPESRWTVGQALIRTPGHVLSMRGEKNYNKLAAALRLLWLYRQGQTGRRSLVPDREDLIEVLEENPGIRDCISAAGQIRHLVSESCAGFLAYVLGEIDPQAADRFFADLKDGIGLEKGDPVLTLRDGLLANRRERGVRVEEAATIARVFKSWNARRQRRRPHKGSLEWKDGEDFPVPV